MSGTRYSINSFHISVGAGDAAIHLLLQQSQGPRDENIDLSRGGLVIGASWIDGGPESYGPSHIKTTFEHILGLYTIPTASTHDGTPILKLDSVFITH